MGLRYIVREGISGIYRAKLAVFASVTAIALAIFLLSVLARFGWNAYEVAITLKKSVEVELFLLDLETSERNRLVQSLKKEKIVRNIHFVSKDSAAAIFLRAFGNEGKALADLSFLPASLQIKMHETATLEEIDAAVGRWSRIQGVDEVKFNRQLVEVLEKRLDSLIRLGIGMGGLILLIAMVLVFNTIRLTIYAKRNVIRAMKLVGATNGFIRRPFQVEGLIQALTGSGLAMIAHYLLFSKVIPKFIPQLGRLSWPYGDWKVLTAAALSLAVIMSLAGAGMAARTFIRSREIS